MKSVAVVKAVILILMLVAPTAVSAAITVHLKNGEEIQALSAWQAGDTVYVLRNRDILLEIDKGEVDFSKSRIRKGEAPSKRDPAISPAPSHDEKATPAETKSTSQAAPEAAPPTGDEAK